MTHTLSTSYKGLYPFRLATTSFIYPDHYVPNVKRLGPYLDEIELLMFESHADPGRETIAELADLAHELDISYNIHMPVDIDPGASDPSVRRRAVETILRFIDRTAPLDPSTRTLHLALDGPTPDEHSRAHWQEHLTDSFSHILHQGLPGRALSIETLDYPIEWVDPVIQRFDLSVCIDIGHLIRYDADLDKIINAYSDRTAIMHLHGVAHNQDHLALDCFPPDMMASLIDKIKRFKGVISLEVFSFSHLEASLKTLYDFWKNRRSFLV